MIKNHKAFSLIEVIIAASILSVTVFWVYKLIGENTKLISNAWNYVQLNTLFPALEECITNLQESWTHDFTTEIVWYNTSFNFWIDLQWCERWNSNNVIIDNLDYSLEWEIFEKNTDFLKWKLTIEWDWVQQVSRNFIQRL